MAFFSEEYFSEVVKTLVFWGCVMVAIQALLLLVMTSGGH